MKIYNFTHPDHQHRWRSLDDWVMGGRSSSHMQFCEFGAQFSGHVSLANNGGFASIHSPDCQLNLSEYDGITLQVQGDGKRYGFILRDDGPLQLRYQVGFDTIKETPQTIHLLFEKFMPMVMGTELDVAPQINRQKISVMGFIIADYQHGDFNLHIQSIRAMRVQEFHCTG